MQSFKLLLSLVSFPFPFLLTFTLEDGSLPLSAFLLALSPNDTDTLCECDSFLGFLLDLIIILICCRVYDGICYLLNELGDHGVIMLWQELVEFRSYIIVCFYCTFKSLL